MGTQQGVIKLDGKFGPISLYQSRGRWLARMAWGPDRNRIMTDPAYARTRENLCEFGGASTVGKALRLLFAGAAAAHGDPYLTGRMTQLFKRMGMQGPGLRGRRAIMPSVHPQMLLGLELNRHKPFAGLFAAPYTLTHTAARNQAQLAISDLQPVVHLHGPEGATHFRLTLVLGSLSDHTYDEMLGRYMPLNMETNGLTVQAHTDVLPLHGTAALAISLQVAFAGAPVLAPETCVLAALGLVFYQVVNGEFYALAGGNGMRVVEVW